MQTFTALLKKYLTVFLAVALVVAAAVMSLNSSGLTAGGNVVGEGKGDNSSVSTREEFDVLLEGSVAPLAARFVQDEELGAAGKPAFESLTLCVGRDWSDSEGDNRTNYVLALTMDAVYLKWVEEEEETEEQWGL